MIGNIKRASVLGLAFALCSGFATQAETIKTFSAVLPPFSIGDADMPGITHELLLEISERTDLEFDFEYLPFKRMNAEIQKTPNSLAFTVLRSPAREDMFNWIVEVIVTNEVFATTSAQINTTDEAIALKSVTTLEGSPRAKRLEAAGLSNLQPATDPKTSATLLNKGRVEAWYTFDHRARYLTKAQGFDPATIVVGAPIVEAPLWLASNKTFDPEVAKKLKAAIEELKADGTYDKIVAKYTE
jgi:ABC-type amino acid transport substrate-binding protein